MTLTDLLMHRAGLSDAAGYIIPLGESLEAKLTDPAAWRDAGPSGEAAFEYANLGSPLVATALEAASGERYDRLVERLVFAPLGVKACLNWIGCGPEMETRAVTLYRHTGEVAADGPDRLPPACTIPVAKGDGVRSRGLRPRHQCLDFLARRAGCASGWSIWRKLGRPSLPNARTYSRARPCCQRATL